MGNKSAKPMQMSARAVLARRAQQQEMQQAQRPVEVTASPAASASAAADPKDEIKPPGCKLPINQTSTVPISTYVSAVEEDGMPQIESGLLQTLAKMNLIKSEEIPSSKDNGHLAVLIRVRKDEELLQTHGSEQSAGGGGVGGGGGTLVVGGGRLAEGKLVEMMEAMRDDPVVNNPVDIAERYKLGVHTAVTISTSVRAPKVVRDADGNFYAI